ncbi:radical SAM protein [Candidatus Alkanophaga liquidiphilum]|nr:MAG: molybdenum cofactor biosynthesis protein MoaA [Candidatus Alkanophagales archaeon]
MYPRFLTPASARFDPVGLARRTEKIVCRGNKRKYTDFYVVGVYGGIATGYAVGCCLRCVFCWVGLGREFPERFGKFYSPEEAFKRLDEVARRRKVRKLRISGAEPTLCRRHLLELLELVERSPYELFILETNGILLADQSYVAELSRFEKVHVRVSLKAGTPGAFSRKTGAVEAAFELPFEAIRNLIRHGLSFHVAVMSDPRIMSGEERTSLLRKLKNIDARLLEMLEEEVADPYETTLLRLEKAGLKWERAGRRRG